MPSIYLRVVKYDVTSLRSLESTCFCPILFTYGIGSAIKSKFAFNFGTDLVERIEFSLPRWLKVFCVQWLAVSMSPKLMIWIEH